MHSRYLLCRHQVAVGFVLKVGVSYSLRSRNFAETAALGDRTIRLSFTRYNIENICQVFCFCKHGEKIGGFFRAGELRRLFEHPPRIRAERCRVSKAGVRDHVTPVFRSGGAAAGCLSWPGSGSRRSPSLGVLHILRTRIEIDPSCSRTWLPPEKRVFLYKNDYIMRVSRENTYTPARSVTALRSLRRTRRLHRIIQFLCRSPPNSKKNEPRTVMPCFS
jgi:hypothetical protein